jgi:hypothetical protein
LVSGKEELMRAIQRLGAGALNDLVQRGETIRPMPVRFATGTMYQLQVF